MLSLPLEVLELSSGCRLFNNPALQVAAYPNFHSLRHALTKFRNIGRRPAKQIQEWQAIDGGKAFRRRGSFPAEGYLERELKAILPKINLSYKKILLKLLVIRRPSSPPGAFSHFHR